MHRPSTRVWRGIAGFLLGVVLDGLALLGLGFDKSFDVASPHAKWLEIFMLPHTGIAVLSEYPPFSLLNVLGPSSIMVFLLALYPLATTVCFVLPWGKKRTVSVVVTAVIVVAILSFGVVGFRNLNTF